LHILHDFLARGLDAGRTGSPPKRLVELLETADGQVDRLARLVEDLLDVSRLTTGQPTLDLEPADLVELARTVVERYETDGRKAGSSVEVRAPGPVIGRWDRNRIEQVLANLLTNAVKYGSGRPVEVTIWQSSDHAKLSIRDHGIGIAAADQERIFERFGRAVPVQHFGGFGLGLHISRELVQAHGGTIRVESRLGEGACFTLTLPLSPREG
jgi:signal transduction histidine kinase